MSSQPISGPPPLRRTHGDVTPHEGGPGHGEARRTAHRSMANPDVAVLPAAARREHGLTIARAAELAGISAGMVSMLEHGRPQLSVVVAEILADVYRMAPRTLELLMAEALEGVGRDSPFYRTRMLRRRS